MPQQAGRPAQQYAWIFRIIGELFVTAGIVLLLFVAWDLWWTNVEAEASQSQAVRDFALEINGPIHSENEQHADGYGPPVVAEAPDDGETIGIMYIPRFGDNYARPIVQATTPEVLDSLGLGHYVQTAMPGAVGNFAVAGHRQTHGAVLDDIHSLVPGDKLYVQTRDGYYVYIYRNTQIVLPTRTDVLLPVPALPSAVPTESVLTMTSCNPRFGSQERIIAYSILDDWQPISAGPPPEISAQVAATLRAG